MKQYNSLYTMLFAILLTTPLITRSAERDTCWKKIVSLFSASQPKTPYQGWTHWVSQQEIKQQKTNSSKSNS